MAHDALTAFAHALADAAAAQTLPRYRRGLTADNKAATGRFDPVTEADRAAEAAIRDLIDAHHPDHGVIGEEFGVENADAEFVWVIDPVDGTRAFLAGMPVWGTLIGLLRDGAPFLGMADHPFLGERFWGDGAGAWRRSPLGAGPIRSRRPAALAEATLWAGSTTTDDPALFGALRALAPALRTLRFGADCYAQAMLAEGHIDIVVETGLEIYDIAAWAPIIAGAGGAISGLDGGPAIHAATIVSAGDPALHAVALTRLRGER